MRHFLKTLLFLIAATLVLAQMTTAQSPRPSRYKAEILPPTAKAREVKLLKEPTLELFRNNEAIIRWTSTNPGGSDEHWALIKYGTDPKNLSETAKSHIRLNRAHSDTLFRVRVENVKPGTTYYYTIASMNADGSQDALKSGTYHLTTPDHDWVAPVPALREAGQAH